MEIKTYKDYIKELKSIFKDVPEEDLDKIFRYGLVNIIDNIFRGNEINIKNNEFKFFIGKFIKDSKEDMNHYIKKLKNQLKESYYSNQKVWDNYYYFSLTPEQYSAYLKNNYIEVTDIKLCKLPDYIMLDNFNKDMYLFKIKSEDDLSFQIKIPYLKSKKIYFIKKLPKKTFSEIMTSNYRYKILNKKRNINGTNSNKKYFPEWINNGSKSDKHS